MSLFMFARSRGRASSKSSPSSGIRSELISVVPALLARGLRLLLDGATACFAKWYTGFSPPYFLPKLAAGSAIVPSVCFMGGGQLWPFALGVGHFLFENFDHGQIRIFASSCGLFSMVPLACGLDPYEWCKRDWGKCVAHMESRSQFLAFFGVGCLFDMKQWHYDLWDNFLPPDAHERCNG